MVSMLEDLWHDFEFFRNEAAARDQPDGSATDRLVAKRYYRAALLLLMFYLEGVANAWLKQLLTSAEFEAIERKCLDLKIRELQKRSGNTSLALPTVGDAKSIRNALAHLKPGHDLELYDTIGPTVLASTEDSIAAWLRSISAALHIEPHPDTESESRSLCNALGNPIPGTEGSSKPGKAE